MCIKNTENDKIYDSISDAINSENENLNLQFQSDIDLNDSFKINKKSHVSIDLNGFTLNMTDTINVNKCESLYLKNGNITCNSQSCISLSNQSDLTAESIKFNCKGSILSLNNKSKVYVKGCEMISESTDSDVISVSGKDTYFEIDSQSKIYSSYSTCLKIKNGAFSRIYGELSKGPWKNKPCIVVTDENSNVVLQKTSYISSSIDSAISILRGGKCEICGATIKKYGENNPAILLQNAKSILDIYDADISSEDGISVLCDKVKDGYTNHLNIFGGTFYSGIISNSSRNTVISVCGGVFYERPDDEFIKNGYCVENLGNDCYKVSIKNKPEIVIDSAENFNNCDKKLNESIVINKPVNIYKSPNKKQQIGRILGVIHILGFEENSYGRFAYVKHKSSGIGTYYYGYIYLADIN